MTETRSTLGQLRFAASLRRLELEDAEQLEVVRTAAVRTQTRATGAQTREVIDIMADRPPPNPFDRPEQVAAFAANCAAIGVNGVAQRSTALLTRAAELEQEARNAKEWAGSGYIAARDRLERGDLDVRAFGVEASQFAVWLDHDAEHGRVSTGMGAVMHVCQQLRSNSVQAFMAEATTIYGRLSEIAAQQIAIIAAQPALPASLWGAADPQAEAGRAGWGHYWVDADVAARRYAECHRLAAMLRGTPGMAQLILWPPGCPTWAAAYKRWDLAIIAGIDAIRRLVLPLRLRKAVDDGWGPGLWTARDLSADPKAEAPKEERKFFAALR